MGCERSVTVLNGGYEMSEYNDNRKGFEDMKTIKPSGNVKAMNDLMDLSDIVKIRDLMAASRKGLLHKIAALAFIIGAAAALIPGNRVYAREVVATIQGTVTQSTTEDTLKLFSLNSGSYEIKIDSDTDKSKCKEIVPGKSVYVGVYIGSDSKLHADRITGAEVDPTLSKTKSTATQAALLAMKKSDSDEGGDKSADSSEKTDETKSSDDSNASQAPANTIEVSGTPTDKSSSNTLYLKTGDGVMYIVIDDSTDTSGGFMFTEGNKLTAYVYRGDDANMHAAKITGKRAESVTLNGSSITFTGTIGSKSKEDTIYLNTSGGTMTFRVDQSTSLDNAKGLVKGKIVTISGAVGSDDTWHATSISAK